MAAVEGRGAAREREAVREREAPRRREVAGSLVERCAAGERAALARAISVVEDRRPGFRELLAHMAALGRRASRTGITGPPGAGKSTLVAGLARGYREAGEEVGIVAVDPTSPYSGGAVLGDRVRMSTLQLDRGAFIRSMATRGAGGGLAEAVHDVTDLMEGCGFDHILLETVGVGQTELGVAAAADTVVLVLTPESGDQVQAMKAGLAEVADVFVVNKADRPGARALVRQLRDALGLRSNRRGAAMAGGADDMGVESATTDPSAPAASPWKTPVLAAVATTGEGTQAVADALEEHRRHLARTGALEVRRLARAAARVEAALRVTIERHLSTLVEDGGIAAAARAVADGEETVYDAVERLLARGGILPGTPAEPSSSPGSENP